MIHPSRVRALNSRPLQPGRYVLYWMQASQRAECNHALEYAVTRADELDLPLLVCFGLTPDFPEANSRHYRFMLQGLAETCRQLRARGVQLVVRTGAPDRVAVALSSGAAMAVVDRGYLRLQVAWRAAAARDMACPLLQVESDAVVPVDQASTREEYSAATFRPRLHRQLEAYLLPLAERAPRRSSLGLEVPSLDPGDPERLLASLGVDSSVPPAPGFHGGTTAARQRLQHFIEHHLDDYPLARSDPSRDRLSGLSPYLHFGHISPLYVALEIAATGGPGADAFLEQLLVRRELALNFVARNPAYDAWEGLPAWSRQTLEEHAADAREYLYTRAQLERAETHDPYWNAAQREMVLSGTMHGYMRMYWGKKVLEWSRHPREALATALYLNNRYQLDGRDPNSFAGVAWCFGKHDRPWRRRPVFGTVRAMTAAGLRRKFDIEAYVRRVQRLAAPPHPH